MILFCAALSCPFIFYGVGPEHMNRKVAAITYEVGNSWLIVLLYCVLIFLLLDILRLVRLVPKNILIHNAACSIVIIGVLCLIFSYGYWKYMNKERVEIDLKTEKKITRSYNIVLMSDLHLGYHNRRAELAKWIEKINAEDPDYVLIAGDIVDINIRPLLEENMAEEFRKIKAPIYACLGNHEYYSGDTIAEQFYRDANIKLLRDETVNIGKDISIIGRDDRTNVHRKNINELTKDVEKSRYIILLDHQPYHLDRTQHAGIDFQFSGHTHDGQVWPISLITKYLYEDSYGQYQRGKTQYYVTSGIGIWGGKFRIGTQSEYIVANIHD